ncbi:DUF2671 domain-containing protein [Candidatus Sneabacter namystus]|nr:DUF2671 domain-containing protein [Candidatus Sneabacter namystus]
MEKRRKNTKAKTIKKRNKKSENILQDLKYMCVSSNLILDALKRGCEVAQLPNGDLIVTEVKTFSVQYRWDKEAIKLTKLPNS